MIETLVNVVLYVVVLGFVMWLLIKLIDIVPMEETYKNFAHIALKVIGILILIFLALSLLGVVPDAGLPRPIRFNQQQQNR